MLLVITKWSTAVFLSWPYLITTSTSPYPPCLQGHSLVSLLSARIIEKSDMTWHEREAERKIRREGDVHALQQIIQCQSQHAFHACGWCWALQILPLPGATEEILSHHNNNKPVGSHDLTSMWQACDGGDTNRNLHYCRNKLLKLIIYNYSIDWSSLVVQQVFCVIALPLIPPLR